VQLEVRELEVRPVIGSVTLAVPELNLSTLEFEKLNGSVGVSAEEQD
jgi:hypothetical protein